MTAANFGHSPELMALVLGPYAPPGLAGADLFPRTVTTIGDLPAIYRRTDDGTLTALAAAMFDLTGALEVYVDAINYVPPDEGGPTDGTLPGSASILTDPARTICPAWLAQAVGVDLVAAGIVNPYSPEARESIATPVNGWRAGSTAALATAARRSLTGARTVRVRANVTPDPFVITVSTATTETPDPAQLEADLRAVLPAGHDLELDNAVGDWAGLEALAPTWADIELLTSAELEELYA